MLFDNIPAAMWYASATQINAIVPYEIAGRATTLMQVVYRGTPSSTVNLQVAAAAPGIFVTSTGQAAAFNQNGTVNGPSNPTPKEHVSRAVRHRRRSYHTGRGHWQGDTRRSDSVEASRLTGLSYHRRRARRRAICRFCSRLGVRRLAGEPPGARQCALRQRCSGGLNRRHCQQPGAGHSGDSITLPSRDRKGVPHGPRRATKGEKDAAAVRNGIYRLDRVFRGAVTTRKGQSRGISQWAAPKLQAGTCATYNAAVDLYPS